MSVAFVLGGGGGPLGAHEVGMLCALIERGIRPDLVLGTSVGAINGAAVAADPSVAGVERLTDPWSAIDRTDVLGGSVFQASSTQRALSACVAPIALLGEHASVRGLDSPG